MFYSLSLPFLTFNKYTAGIFENIYAKLGKMSINGSSIIKWSWIIFDNLRNCFLFLPQCFQNSSAADASKCICKWERVNNLRQLRTLLCNITCIIWPIIYCGHSKELSQWGCLNPFPHTTNLQQTTLKTYPKKIGNSI